LVPPVYECLSELVIENKDKNIDLREYKVQWEEKHKGKQKSSIIEGQKNQNEMKQ
jgi:hypothetical protein